MSIQARKNSNQSDVYMNSLLCELLVQSHNLENELPSFDLLNNAFSLFNEEVGEMSFSVLARLMYSKSHEVDLNIVNKLYVLVHEYAALDDDIVADLDKKGMRNGFTKINYEGETAKSIRYFLTTIVRQLRCNQFKIYTGEPKFGNPVFMPQGKKDLIQWTVRQVKPLLWISNMEEALQNAFKKLKVSLEKPVKDLDKYWPEFRTMVDPFDRDKMVLFPMDLENSEQNLGEVDTINFDVTDADRCVSSSESTDEEAPLGQDPAVRQAKFARTMGRFPSKVNKPWRTNTVVWTIDFPERNEPETAWKITMGRIMPRAVKGRKKDAIATPIDCERVQCLDNQGNIEVFDILKTNLDRSQVISERRLKSILEDIGVVPRVQDSDEKNEIVPIEAIRSRNVEEQERLLLSLGLVDTKSTR